jgi:hypothetical protein
LAGFVGGLIVIARIVLDRRRRQRDEAGVK